MKKLHYYGSNITDMHVVVFCALLTALLWWVGG